MLTTTLILGSTGGVATPGDPQEGGICLSLELGAQLFGSEVQLVVLGITMRRVSSCMWYWIIWHGNEDDFHLRLGHNSSWRATATSLGLSLVNVLELTSQGLFLGFEPLGTTQSTVFEEDFLVVRLLGIRM